MAPTTASSTSPRYAPADPSLPKPWRGLVDGSTGNSYFWNLVTNVTRYEKPVADAASPRPPSSPPPPTLASTDISSPSEKPPKSIHNETVSSPSAQQSPASSLAVDAYRRQHEITISEKDEPPPFMTFSSTGFSTVILREVRYLLHDGANVVHCTVLFVGDVQIVLVPL
ncbi:hypothetical protein GIB67_040816 [Kingdonia uniflora]|uniref:WW domain-containing protein n=1 Tax=Kingdonia uniflora TaxID=39325 RepID=A0A7J7P4T5_9MAGN|nr:hypothetical protein GIB67_040816 [Kingdonia uniflora]